MRICVADIEANGLLDTVSRIWCGVFTDVETRETFRFRPDQLREMTEFMDQCKALAFHNGLGYDFPAIEKVLGYKFKGTKIDTLVLSRMLFYDIPRPMGCRAGPHSIEAWGIRFKLYKPEHEDWSQFSEEMLVRCERDTEILLRLYNKCMQEIKKSGWPSSTIRMTFKLFEMFQQQEQYGWKIDVPLLNSYIGTLDRWIQRIDKVLVPNLPYICIPLEPKVQGEYKYVSKVFTMAGKYTAQVLKHYPDELPNVGGPFSRIGFRQVNLSSDKEVKEMLLADGWIPKEYNYKKDPNTGKVLTDNRGNPVVSSPKLSPADPFIGVNGKVGRLIAKRTQIQHRKSVLEGFTASVRADGRMSQVITGIAATGRLTHGGIVNVPSADAFFGKQMRKIFSAKDGYKIVGTDAVSCQDRMLAARANNPEFTRMLLEGDKEAGTDGHSLAMHAINAVLVRHRLEPISRKVAKNFNYGWKFGASDNKLGKMAKGTKDVGAEIRTALSEVFPAQAALIERLTQEWKSTAEVYMNDYGKLAYRNGIIRGLDGRPIRIPSEHQILVYMLQSDEAIMMQAAVLRFVNLCDKKGWKHGQEYGFVANVHDEFSIEVREDLAEEAARMTCESIAWSSDYFKLACAQQGEAAIGNNWYEVH